MENRVDIYIKGINDPLFEDGRIENISFIDTVIAKLYMILQTNKGEVLGDPNFGSDIPKYLWATKFPSTTIQASIQEQIESYIPELQKSDYMIKVYIMPGKTQDIGIIEINVLSANINMLFK